ncbi:7-cyano-7-deazaguanine synthase [Archangium gephyra]|nr:7-cyano-7-deazaguanine synthase [Archangium gephyra]
MKTALLLSGGMDSIAIAWWRRPELAITVDYGQRPALAELRAAASAAEAMGIEHLTVKADLSALGSGDMAGAEPLSLAPVTEWWPFRNQMLVTLAAMKAVAHGVQRLLIGTLKTDGLHADGRPDFVTTLDALLRLQEGGLRLEAPAIALTSAELIRTSNIPMEVLAWAHSCHVGIHACGRCRGCQKHYQTLAELGVDPY